MTWTLAYALGAAAAWACIALQASANGTFRRNLGDPWYPAFFSICGTFVTAITVMLLLRPPTPSAESLRSTQWWNWVGGQLVCSVLLDHFALMGLPEQSITPGRVAGVALVVAGVMCIKYL